MANPPGTRANRWNQVVSATASALQITTAAADGVWTNRYVDETAGDAAAHAELKKWLEANDTVSVTLPKAFERFVV